MHKESPNHTEAVIPSSFQQSVGTLKIKVTSKKVRKTLEMLGWISLTSTSTKPAEIVQIEVK